MTLALGNAGDVADHLPPSTIAPPHVAWLVDTEERIQTAEGREIEIWELRHTNDAGVLSSWAKHFRHHYCDDDMLTKLAAGTPGSHATYLIDYKFPDAKVAPGPSVRAGDFAEILIADYVEYKLGYWCPRHLRYDNKWSRNESTKGCDVIGFRFASTETANPNDELFIFETKATLSGKSVINRLQDAVDDSAKDPIRESTTLNALKQRYLERGDDVSALKVQRFQNMADRPFKRINGAAAVCNSELVDAVLLAGTAAKSHPNAENLKLIVVKGATLMTLVHTLYERAANAT